MKTALTAIVSLALLAACLPLAGCQQQQSPAARLTLINDAATLGLNVLADAKAAGLITDAEVQQIRPLADAYRAAERTAGNQIRAAEVAKAAGQPVDENAVKDSLAQATAAWSKLAPWVVEVQNRKKARSP